MRAKYTFPKPCDIFFTQKGEKSIKNKDVSRHHLNFERHSLPQNAIRPAPDYRCGPYLYERLRGS